MGKLHGEMTGWLRTKTTDVHGHSLPGGRERMVSHLIHQVIYGFQIYGFRCNSVQSFAYSSSSSSLCPFLSLSRWSEPNSTVTCFDSEKAAFPLITTFRAAICGGGETGTGTSKGRGGEEKG